MDNGQVMTALLENLLRASQATMALWNEHGLGDDENESEPVYNQLRCAISDARSGLAN